MLNDLKLYPLSNSSKALVNLHFGSSGVPLIKRKNEAEEIRVSIS